MNLLQRDMAGAIPAVVFGGPMGATTTFEPADDSPRWRWVLPQDVTGTTIPRLSEGGVVAVGAALAVEPGRVLTRSVLAWMRRRRELLALIHQLAGVGFSRVAGRVEPVTATAAASAKAFISMLPQGAKLPRVVPDGEGGLMAIWGDGVGELMAIIDDAHIHFVVHPTAPNAKYYDDVPFSGSDFLLPPEVLEILSS
jgi:hypothetical protein